MLLCPVCAYLLHRDHSFEPFQREKLKKEVNHIENKLHDVFDSMQKTDDSIKHKKQVTAQVHKDMQLVIENECSHLMQALEKQKEAVKTKILSQKEEKMQQMKKQMQILKQMQEQLGVQATGEQTMLPLSKEEFTEASVRIFQTNIQPFCAGKIIAHIPTHDFSKHISNLGAVTAASMKKFKSNSFIGVPSKPTPPVIFLKPQGVFVSWNLPDANGAEISYFRVEYRMDADMNWHSLYEGTEQECIFTEDRGTGNVHFKVQCANVVGFGEWSEDSTANIPASAASVPNAAGFSILNLKRRSAVLSPVTEEEMNKKLQDALVKKALNKKQLSAQKTNREEQMVKLMETWQKNIISNWEKERYSKNTSALCFQYGVPPKLVCLIIHTYQIFSRERKYGNYALAMHSILRRTCTSFLERAHVQMIQMPSN